MSEMTDPNAAETPAAAETPTVSVESAPLEAQLEEARRKADEYLSGWRRTLAEFDNYRKRAEKER
ncbi:MAG: nucleotide exchange factor GrpE, partial [Aggregatilineales bacterium]